MSDTPKSPLLETQMPKMPPVVRLELPAALELLLVLQLVADSVALTVEQLAALRKFEQRIREAESRS